MNLTISCLLTIQIGPAVLEKKMLKDDAQRMTYTARRTTHADGRQL